MSSYNKTENLELNLWHESDVPKRTDFNYDNEILDRAISNHHNDEVRHITAQERVKWNDYIYMGTYFGNGQYYRDIITNCPFDVAFGVIYAHDRPPSIHYNDDNSTYHYMAFVSSFGESGARLKENYRDLTLYNSLEPAIQRDYHCMNESGIMYRYVLFRDNRAVEI